MFSFQNVLVFFINILNLYLSLWSVLPGVQIPFMKFCDMGSAWHCDTACVSLPVEGCSGHTLCAGRVLSPVSPTGALRSRRDLVQLHRFWYGGGFKAGNWTMLNKHRVACRGFRHWAYAGERLFLLPVSKWQGILQFVLHKGDFTESFRNG